MIVVSFYFWMTEANENFFLCLMFLIFKTINDNKLTMIQVNWLELDDLKFAMSCKTRLWIFEEKNLVYNIFCVISKSYRCRSLPGVNETTQLYHTKPDIHNNCSLLFCGNFVQCLLICLLSLWSYQMNWKLRSVFQK